MVYGIQAAQKVHPLLQYIKAPLLPEIRNLAAYKNQAAIILKPRLEDAVKAKNIGFGQKTKDESKLNLIA